MCGRGVSLCSRASRACMAGASASLLSCLSAVGAALDLPGSAAIISWGCKPQNGWLCVDSLWTAHSGLLQSGAWPEQ